LYKREIGYILVQGKLPEREGRKAAGLKSEKTMTAELHKLPLYRGYFFKGDALK